MKKDDVMQIIDNQIHVWAANLTLKPDAAAHFPLLTKDEVERANRLLSLSHKTTFMMARSLLRQILARYLLVPAEAIRFGYTAYQKPFLIYPQTPLQFNLSHSRQLMVLAMSHYPIGIDCEHALATERTGIAKRFFTPTENNLLIRANPAQKKHIFYRLWSQKEALLKAVGCGLSHLRHDFTCQAKDYEEIIYQGQPWSLFNLPIHADYACTLATVLRAPQIKYFSTDK